MAEEVELMIPTLPHWQVGGQSRFESKGKVRRKAKYRPELEREPS